MKKLNLNELLVGFCIGFFLVFWIHWWVLLVAPICAILWALGGAYGHSIRVFGVSAVLIGTMALYAHNWWVLLLYPVEAALFSIGYGIPTYAPGRPDDDKGSALGRFWYKVFNGNETLANIFTRGTIYLMVAVTLGVPMLTMRKKKES